MPAETHGGSYKPEYGPWRGMFARCRARKGKNAKNYRARGIKVCKRWYDFNKFLADMGPRPSPRHSIDRIDNNGNYEPGNCRWATAKEQARNTSCNMLIDVDGKQMCLSAWAEELGLSRSAIANRLMRGLDPKVAVSHGKLWSGPRPGKRGRYQNTKFNRAVPDLPPRCVAPDFVDIATLVGWFGVGRATIEKILRAEKEAMPLVEHDGRLCVSFDDLYRWAETKRSLGVDKSHEFLY